MNSTEPQSVLILCTGNSCRSQMAEVLWNQIGNGNWQASSAGSRPSGYVHPSAIKALEELDLPVNGLTSKSTDLFKEQPFDLVVTVCDHAREACPVWPFAQETLHWPFSDPADATGTPEEQMVVFRDVRDQIRQKIQCFIDDQET